MLSVQQRTALGRLGIPNWQLREQTEANAACYYRLGKLLLVFSEPVMVTKPSWLDDLVTTSAESLVALNERAASHWDNTNVVDFRSGVGVFPASEVKQQLWRHLYSLNSPNQQPTD
ncbi:MAG: hypothetical protein WEA82_05065 [Idiomarina sp.]